MLRGLKTPYQGQKDNRSGTGWRECFSSSVAMLLMHEGRIESDDAYNLVRERFGDTTDPQSHLRAVSFLGLKPSFSTTCDRAILERSLARQRPAALGWLHRGPVTRPTGGGHWGVCIGSNSTHLLLHDPFGEPDLVRGGHLPGRSGSSVLCTWGNFRPRWEVEGPGTGYCFTVAP